MLTTFSLQMACLLLPMHYILIALTNWKPYLNTLRIRGSNELRDDFKLYYGDRVAFNYNEDWKEMKALTLTSAAKLQMIMDLLNPPIYDDEGNLVGYEEEGLITREEALELLDLPQEIEE